jgi:hypothetical protein
VLECARIKLKFEASHFILNLFLVIQGVLKLSSSGLSRGHPVDQVKMLKKQIAVTLKKTSKLPIFVQKKYLINILAMLYFPFEQKLEK